MWYRAARIPHLLHSGDGLMLIAHPMSMDRQASQLFRRHSEGHCHREAQAGQSRRDNPHDKHAPLKLTGKHSQAGPLIILAVALDGVLHTPAPRTIDACND